jgi:hypothetical protein
VRRFHIDNVQKHIPIAKHRFGKPRIGRMINPEQVKRGNQAKKLTALANKPLTRLC